MELRPDQIAAGNIVRENMTRASDMQTDTQASLTPSLHPIWMKSDWNNLKLNSKRRHNGEIYRFCQPSLTDESQNREPGSVGSESIWAWLNYRNGYRVIPETIFATAPFTVGERGWWTDGKLYESKTNNNVYTPAQYAANWTLIDDISDEIPIDDSEPIEPEQPIDEWPDWKPWSGKNEDLHNVGDKVTHKSKRWISTQPNNHWEPGVYGWSQQ